MAGVFDGAHEFNQDISS
ncbi:hypothetical protein JIY74_24635 [Vibrio harveyi]|nr:hypothetical protein [Vibrio harveyi]